MSKKTLALILTLLLLTIILIGVALTTRNTKTANTEQPTTQEQQEPTPTPDMAKTTLKLTPNPVYPDTGSTSATTVNVEIDTGENNVSAVQLEIQYDPAVLTNMKVLPGDFFTNPNVLPVGGVDIQKGTITYALGPSNIRESKSGTGVVATLQFVPRAAAGVTETEITLLDKSLVTQFGQAESVLKEVQSTRVVLPLTNQRTPQRSASPSGQ